MSPPTCDGCGAPTPAPHTTRFRPPRQATEFKWCPACCPDCRRGAHKPARSKRRKAPPEKMSMNP